MNNMRARRANQLDGDGEKLKGHKGKKSQPHVQPMVPNTVLWPVVLFFIIAGFAQEHYRESRSRDPFRTAQNLASDHSKSTKQQNVPRKELEVIDQQNEEPQEQQQQNEPPQQLGIGTSMLTPEEDDALELDKDGVRYHMVFSTDCSPFQHWQSYLVYFSAMKVRQTGHVTRIASGCDEQQTIAMKEWFERDVQYLSKRFHLQLTPHFSSVKNEKGESVGDYKFFNKPFGFKYWLENSPQLNWDEASGFSDNVANDVAILIDPDMALLRPITSDFSVESETLVAEIRKPHIVTRKVAPGKPVAQLYGFGAQWLTKLNVTKIAGEGTPAAKYNTWDARLYFPAGPPYLGVVPDMHAIAQKWTEFVPGVHAQYPYLLAEMFGFCLAAAHLDLKLQIINSLMISDLTSGDAEGWPLVENIPPAEVCDFARNIDHSKYPVPSVIHMCQRYVVGEDWFFGKRAMPIDIFDCEQDLFEEPPSNLATAFDYKQAPGGQKEAQDSKDALRNAFVVCHLYGLVNEAATFYKKNACSPDHMNLKKLRNLAKFMRSPHR
jgi:hypothetical protein